MQFKMCTLIRSSMYRVQYVELLVVKIYEGTFTFVKLSTAIARICSKLVKLNYNCQLQIPQFQRVCLKERDTCC